MSDLIHQGRETCWLGQARTLLPTAPARHTLSTRSQAGTSISGAVLVDILTLEGR